MKKYSILLLLSLGIQPIFCSQPSSPNWDPPLNPKQNSSNSSPNFFGIAAVLGVVGGICVVAQVIDQNFKYLNKPPTEEEKVAAKLKQVSNLHFDHCKDRTDGPCQQTKQQYDELLHLINQHTQKFIDERNKPTPVLPRS